jgi:hypothetical protein
MAIATLAWSRPAFCEEPPAIHVDIELSLNPEQPTISADTLLHDKFPNFGVGALNTFAPEVTFNQNSIFVSLWYQSPDIEPTFPIDLRFAPEETINLGRLGLGTYNVMATFPSPTGFTIGSAELAFAVVPEPSTAALISVVVLIGGIATRRKR